MTTTRHRRYICDHCGFPVRGMANQEPFACSRCDGTCRLPCSAAEVTRFPRRRNAGELNATVKRLESEAKR